MTFAKLRALHAVIGDALDDIEAIYQDASISEPSPSPTTPSATLSSPYTPYPGTRSRSPPSPPASASPLSGSTRHTGSDSDSNSEPSIPTTLSSPFVSKRNVAATPKTPRSRLRPSGITVQWTPHHSMSTPHHPMTGPPRSPPITPATPGFSHPFSPLYSCCSPLEYPSLDTPFYPTEVNDARSDAAEALTSHPAVIAASNRIVAACGQISAMVQRPFLTLCDAGMGYHLPSCLRFLEASHTVEILRAAGPRGMHVDDLAQHISEIRRGPPLDALNQSSSDSESDVDPGKLSHVLRLLATHHIIREVRPDVYANNRISSLMDSGRDWEALRDAPAEKYESTNGIAAFVGLCTDELFKASAYLTDCYLLPPAEPALPPLTPAISHPPTPTKIPDAESIGSKHPLHAPFNLAFSTPTPYFEWLEHPGNSGRLRRFGRAMTGTGAWEVPGAVIGGFQWQDLPPSALVVDVGGGIGSTSMLLAHAFPHLRFIIQDRPQVVEMGTSAWRARCPEMLDSGRATFVAHDFFTPQPPLRFPGASCACVPAVFLLRVITHDWPDSYVTKILLHLRLAAGPETKLLLADHVLPLACVDEGYDESIPYEKQEPLPGTIRTLAPEDSPLLPNLGKANANAYWLDLTMRVMFNAQERTLREITALTLTAGWKVVQVTRAEGSVFGHITALPVEIPEASLALLSAPSVVSPAANSPGGENDAASAIPRTPEAVVKSPPMGDTFGSRVALPTDAAMSMRPTRRGKRPTIPFGEVPAHAQKRARDPTVPKRRPAALSLAKSPDSVISPKEHRDLAAAHLPTQSMLLPALEPELRHKSSISMLRRGEAKVGGEVKAENGANGTRGLRKMQSRSQLGLACVTVEVHKGVAVQRDRVQVERLNLEED